MKKFNPISIIKYQLYLLQLENYEIRRYFRLLTQKGFYVTSEPQRKELVWTGKIKLILALTIVLFTFKLYFLAYLGLTTVWSLLVLLLGLILLPVAFSIATILLWPFDYVVKAAIVNNAKKLVAAHKQVKVIGIAGSYGKTTMKIVLGSVLSVKYKTILTPDSVNTPIGIARWIINSLKDDTEIMIVEMGEHYAGDVKYLCGITPPDFALVTGINEAHLERMKNLDGVTKTIFEVTKGSKSDALILVNTDDKHVLGAYKSNTTGREVLRYGVVKDSDVKITDKVFDPEKLVWKFTLDGVLKVEVAILGEYIASDVAAAYLVARRLGLTEEEIEVGIRAIVPVTHRLEPIRSPGNILVIDDSYNGNPDGVREAIYLLEKFTKRRKIFITPGIVETGKSNQSVHEKIGAELANVADLVLLIRNSATPHIAEGLLKNGFPAEKIIWYETAEAAHAALGSVLVPNDVILFQNDWGDQYV